MTDARTGGCLCGAVTYRATGPFRPVIACHCGQCRKATGNYVAATSAPRDGVEVAGEVRWFASSPEARRGFCPACGSSLFWDGPGANLSIMAGTLDDAAGLACAGHIFTEGMGAWVDLPDHVRRARGSDPELTTMVQA